MFVCVLLRRRREEEEEKPRIQNQKQEPHTKMWGRRALLRGWCVDKGKIGDCYRKMLTTVRVVAKQGVEEKWITKAEALPEMGGRGTEGSTAERHHQSSPQSLGQGLLGVPSHC